MPFVTRDITDLSLRQELKGRGFQSVPVVFVDGKAYRGFNPAELSAALALNRDSIRTAARTDNMVGRLDRVLAALGRAALQIPPERLSHSVSGGIMTMQSFAYAIARGVEVTVLAGESGTWDHAYLDDNRGASQLTDPTKLASYVEGVRGRFKRWASNLTGQDLSRVCDGYYGPVQLSRLIEISLGRGAFLLRRFYRIMREELGIEPRGAMDETELQEISNPASLAC